MIEELQRLHPAPLVPLQLPDSLVMSQASSPAARPLSQDTPIAVLPESQSSACVQPLQPPAQPSQLPPAQSSQHLPPLDIPHSVIGRAFRHSPRGSSPGPSGLRVEHLLTFLSRKNLDSMLHAVALRFAKADIPAVARPFIYGALLTPLSKPNNGGIRPIAVGELLVRIAGNAIARHQASAFSAFFAPNNQFGVACAAGTDAVFHLVRFLLSTSSDTICVQLDFKNAFNTISRSLIYSQLQTHFPSLLPYFLARYAQPSLLQVVGPGSSLDTTIFSQEGIQQGDPLGPFFFSLALQAVTSGVPQVSSSSQLPTATAHSAPFIASYLDDIHICGSPASVALACKSILDNALRLRSGLQLNAAKSTIFSLTEDPRECIVNIMQGTASSINFSAFRTPREGINILGSPLGSSDFISSSISSLEPELSSVSSRLLKFRSTQTAVLLLRFCGPQRIQHFARSCPPSVSVPHLRSLDNMFTALLAQLQGFSLPDDSIWPRLVHLPQRLGGLGLIAAADIAQLAYLSSFADTLRLANAVSYPALVPLRQFILSLSSLSSECPWPVAMEYSGCLVAFADRITVLRRLRPDTPDPSVDPRFPRNLVDLLTTPPKLQQRLSRLWHEATLAEIISVASPMVRAHLLSNRQPSCSAPLDAIPVSPALSLSNEEFKQFLFNFQCLPELNPVPTTCPCLLNNARSGSLRSDPHHDMHCRLGKGWLLRHNSALSALADCIRSAGYTVYNQSQSVGGSSSRPLTANNVRI